MLVISTLFVLSSLNAHGICFYSTTATVNVNTNFDNFRRTHSVRLARRRVKGVCDGSDSQRRIKCQMISHVFGGSGPFIAANAFVTRTHRSSYRIMLFILGLDYSRLLERTMTCKIDAPRSVVTGMASKMLSDAIVFFLIYSPYLLTPLPCPTKAISVIIYTKHVFFLS